MTSISRLPLILFTLAFGFYHAVLGISSVGAYANPLPIVFGVLLYCAVLTCATVQTSDLRLPDSATEVSLITAGTLPILGAMSIGDSYAVGYTTWYVAGVATLMAVLAVRQRQAAAFVGTSIMVSEVLLWGGPGVLLGSGIIGALLLLLAAQGASRALSSSQAAAMNSTERALTVDAERVAIEEARKLVKSRARLTLDTALPLLQLIEAKRGLLTDAEIKTVLMAEAGLRDRIRGKSLLSTQMVDAVQSARSRGVEVQLLDDGGFEEISEDQKQKITARVTDELARLASGKVVIRSTAGEAWTLTMVALQPGAEEPEVFLRL
ncbi:MAG: hypothetical protein P8M68_03980 [Aquiluna sp.]|nr:hypothetical protein [Aquiluna sp.]